MAKNRSFLAAVKPQFHTMAKNKANECKCGNMHEYFGYGVLITLFGCLWLAQELGWLQIGVPMGPLIAIIIGLSFLLPWLKKGA